MTRRIIYAVLVLFISSSFSSTAAAKGKPQKPGKPGGGGNDNPAECSYPAFADYPKDQLRGPSADFSIQHGPAVAEITSGKDPVFSEDGSNNSGWFVESMYDVQHRTGNPGIDENGDACSGCTPVGKRHSAWYGDAQGSGHDYLIESVLESEASDGIALAIGGKRETLSDPTRPGTPWNNERLNTTWLSTFQRQPGSFGSAKAGSLAFKPPLYIESRVSFEQMQTPGFRLSLWMMPVEHATDTYSPPIAYDDNFDNGFEMDIFEFEPVELTTQGDVCGNLIEFSWIRGFHSGKGKPPSDLNGKNHFEGLEEGYCTDGLCSLTYAEPNGLMNDINEGWHTVGLLWTTEKIVWSFNNEIVLEITDSSMIPTREHYLIVSREITNGLIEGQFESDNQGNWLTYLPSEPGLYGWNGNSNAGEYLDNINDDKALIDYIKVWATPVQF